MQPAFAFEQIRLDQEAAASFESAKTALREQIVERRRRAAIARERLARKAAEKIQKSSRKWKRDHKSKAKTEKDRLWSSCGIHLYNGGCWSVCFRCKRPLVYADLHTATTTNHRDCPGPPPLAPSHTPDPREPTKNTSSPPRPPPTYPKDPHSA
jgi:hypothetical protein